MNTTEICLNSTGTVPEKNQKDLNQEISETKFQLAVAIYFIRRQGLYKEYEEFKEFWDQMTHF